MSKVDEPRDIIAREMDRAERWKKIALQFETALVKIRQEAGDVCEEFEICTHGSCRGSVAGHLIALEALDANV